MVHSISGASSFRETLTQIYSALTEARDNQNHLLLVRLRLCCPYELPQSKGYVHTWWGHNLETPVQDEHSPRSSGSRGCVPLSRVCVSWRTGMSPRDIRDLTRSKT